MRDIIQKILEESKDFYKTVYTIMSEDETMILQNWDYSGGRFNFVPISEVSDENFYKFKFEELSAAETVLSFIPQRFDHLKPKIVKYNVSYFKVEDETNLFDSLNEQEDDGLEWAREVIDTVPVVGSVYRVKLPKSEKAIIDILVVDIDEDNVYDNTRAIVIDPETVEDPENFLKNYNRDDTTYLKMVIEFLEEGHWYPVPKELSLFRGKKFDPRNYKLKF